jgi:hypothetical protein
MESWKLMECVTMASRQDGIKQGNPLSAGNSLTYLTNQIDPTNPTNQIDTLDPANQIDPIQSTNRIDPVGLTNQINHIHSTNQIHPLNDGTHCGKQTSLTVRGSDQ